jgi:nucleoside-diphosphate-sugar epimerase
MNILVTGGSGFIGTHLVRDLIEDGHKVTIFDKRKSKDYPDLCIIGDVRDRDKLIRSVQGIEVVYHLAAEHHDNLHPASLYYEVNVGGAENLARAMEINAIKRLIFTSTVAVYGLNPGVPDETSPVNPFNDYGHSKYEAELVFEKWAGKNHMNSLLIVRPTVIFGEGNRGNVYNLIKQIASKRFMMVGRGKNKKSMGYVLNISKFLTTLLNAGSGRHVYNYADKPDLSTDDLFRITCNTLGNYPTLNFRIPYTVGLVGGYAFDIFSKLTGKAYPISSIRIRKFCADTRVSAAKVRQTGFTAPYLLTEGLKRMISSEFLQDRSSSD